MIINNKDMIINKIVNKIEFYKFKFLDAFLLLLFNADCYCRGVKKGKNTKIKGLPYIHIDNGGHISIGDNCSFWSRQTSNYIGLNHKCILTSTPAYNDSESYLKIGDNCGMSGVSVWCFYSITIGNNVRIGANCRIMDGDAHFDDARTAAPKPIVIEDNVFIGANCVIKKGVSIGENTVIGMNSVVTKDIPANCVAVGSPCKVIRQNC